MKFLIKFLFLFLDWMHNFPKSQDADVGLREQSRTNTKLRSYWQTQHVCWTNVYATHFFLKTLFPIKYSSYFIQPDSRRLADISFRQSGDDWWKSRSITRKHGCMCFQLHVNGADSNKTALACMLIALPVNSVIQYRK